MAKLRLPVAKIPYVTVEIPAIPEDEAFLKEFLFQLKEAGVNYLNLHQLRCTPHNYQHLLNRNYTFLHGEKVMILESELTALRILKHSIDNKVGLPVNYCSFVYKNRFQSLAARRRSAKMVVRPHEDITSAKFALTELLSGINLCDFFNESYAFVGSCILSK